MTNHAFSLVLDYCAESCCECGIGFAVDSSVQRRWRASGDAFYCPNGHRQRYTQSEVQRLGKQLEQTQKLLENERESKEWYKQRQADERAAREATERRLVAAKGQQTKLRKRVQNGVCPCCTRSFTNLRRHMATKHPDHAATV